MGIVNKIRTTLTERPYVKYMFKAAELMRESLLIGSILNNSESWIIISKKDIEKLEMPDKILARHVLERHGNPSTAFMHLELGFLPVRFVIMKKRLNFLRYILNESVDSMIRKVFDTLKTDSRKGDFVDLVNQDIKDNDIDLTETDIKNMSKLQWKKYVNMKVKETAFKYLISEKKEKSKTKHI